MHFRLNDVRLEVMHVEPHMCRAPMYFGMLAASRISRSTSFFRYFSVIHPRSEVYSLVTFEYLAMSVSEGYSARSWAKETGKNSGKEQIFNQC
jgi:hypothetical protein